MGKAKKGQSQNGLDQKDKELLASLNLDEGKSVKVNIIGSHQHQSVVVSAKEGTKQVATTKKSAKKSTKPAKAQDKQKVSQKAPEVKKDTKEEKVLTTKDVAEMVGTTPKALRRVLRAKWYDDKVTTNYGWTKNDPILKEILDYYAKAN